jgi:hypothetical protein
MTESATYPPATSESPQAGFVIEELHLFVEPLISKEKGGRSECETSRRSDKPDKFAIPEGLSILTEDLQLLPYSKGVDNHMNQAVLLEPFYPKSNTPRLWLVQRSDAGIHLNGRTTPSPAALKPGDLFLPNPLTVCQVALYRRPQIGRPRAVRRWLVGRRLVCDQTTEDRTPERAVVEGHDRTDRAQQVKGLVAAGPGDGPRFGFHFGNRQPGRSGPHVNPHRGAQVIDLARQAAARPFGTTAYPVRRL